VRQWNGLDGTQGDGGSGPESSQKTPLAAFLRRLSPPFVEHLEPRQRRTVKKLTHGLSAERRSSLLSHAGAVTQPGDGPRLLSVVGPSPSLQIEPSAPGDSVTVQISDTFDVELAEPVGRIRPATNGGPKSGSILIELGRLSRITTCRDGAHERI
jgi:hypothetical protein